MSNKFRGLGNDNVRAKRETHGGFNKFKDGISKGKMAAIPFAASAISLLPAFQSHADAIMLGALPLAAAYMLKTPNSPFERPYYDKESNKGFFFFGNEIGTGKEVWFSDSEARRHILVFGTTGAGKTEALVGFVANSLAQNSAFTYVDGKADTGLFAKIFSLVRRFGKEDDLLVINYMVGTIRADLKRDKKLSNTLNPFASSTSEALSELITSLLPSGGSSDGIWKDRASVFMSSLMRALVALRDDGHILMDVNVIREYFTLEKIIDLSRDERVKKQYRDGLINYIVNLPGYQVNNETQESTVYEQHGFIVMQFQPCFGMLSDSYGHVMKTQLAECDFNDIVLQRRILLVLLPALEKSPSNLANLGKIIISSIKSMMAGALGAELEGLTEYTLDSKPTNGRTYQAVFDEYGYYSVEGAAVMPAQARGIGFSLIFAGQDYQAFKKGNADEAASIRSNCAIKLCMTLEDPTETADIFIKGAGQDYSTVETGYDREAGMFGAKYINKRDVSIQKVNKIDELDLKGQLAGEYHLINMDKLIRARSFYADPPKPKELRVNSFIRVKPPTFSEVAEVTDALMKLKVSFKQFFEGTNKNFTTSYKKIDSGCKSLIKSINFIEGDGLKSAAFSLALKKNNIDLVNRRLVLKMKELEDYVNRDLNDDEVFNEDYTFEDVSRDDIKDKVKEIEKNEDPKEGVLRRIRENESYILNSIDLDKNPLAASNIDISEASDFIADISEDVINRWYDKGMLRVKSPYVDSDSQSDIATLENQEIMKASNEIKSEIGKVKIGKLDQEKINEVLKNLEV